MSIIIIVVIICMIIFIYSCARISSIAEKESEAIWKEFLRSKEGDIEERDSN